MCNVTLDQFYSSLLTKNICIQNSYWPQTFVLFCIFCNIIISLHSDWGKNKPTQWWWPFKGDSWIVAGVFSFGWLWKHDSFWSSYHQSPLTLLMSKCLNSQRLKVYKTNTCVHCKKETFLKCTKDNTNSHQK